MAQLRENATLVHGKTRFETRFRTGEDDQAQRSSTPRLLHRNMRSIEPPLSLFPSFPLLHPISYTQVCNSLPPCLETKTATASVSIFHFLNPVLSALSVFSSVHPFGPSTFLFPSVLSHSLATAATLLLLRLLPYTSITSFYLPTYCKESSSIIIATSL
jgi:hypothetical protein